MYMRPRLAQVYGLRVGRENVPNFPDREFSPFVGFWGKKYKTQSLNKGEQSTCGIHGNCIGVKYLSATAISLHPKQNKIYVYATVPRVQFTHYIADIFISIFINPQNIIS